MNSSWLNIRKITNKKKNLDTLLSCCLDKCESSTDVCFYFLHLFTQQLDFISFFFSFWAFLSFYSLSLSAISKIALLCTFLHTRCLHSRGLKHVFQLPTSILVAFLRLVASTLERTLSTFTSKKFFRFAFLLLLREWGRVWVQCVCVRLSVFMYVNIVHVFIFANHQQKMIIRNVRS